jgi:hypothetical protein
MAHFLEDTMNKAYSALAQKQKLDVDSSLVKCYLIEAHDLENAKHAEILDALQGAFDGDAVPLAKGARVRETKEEFFFTFEAETKDGKASFYVDATSPRFWLLHSTSRSTVIDPLVRSALANARGLDSAWIPVQLLESTTRLGLLRGLGLDYDRRPVPDVDFEQPGAPVEFLKMQLWGNRAQDVLAVLRKQGAFPDATTLSKVKIKHWLDSQKDSPFSIVDIKYDGKITGRGTSFQSYMTVVTTLYRKYANRVREFEKRFAVSITRRGTGRMAVAGEPLNITFKEPINNLAVFCDHLFSATRPFRLWGVPVKIAKDSYHVAAVDLHVGARFNAEISPDFMRIYLNPGSCGNTLFRLYTNLQHYYHSLIDATDGSGEPAFQFQP